jgi:hypothetical protein
MIEQHLALHAVCTPMNHGESIPNQESHSMFGWLVDDD